jgi:two-component system LytT family sensor kinase
MWKNNQLVKTTDIHSKKDNCFMRYLLLALVIVSISIPLFSIAQGSDDEAGESYYFTLLHYVQDGTVFENSYNLEESDFSSFSWPSLQFVENSNTITGKRVIGRLLSPIGLGVQFNSKVTAFFGYPVNVINKKYTSYNVYDSSRVSIIALGINPENAPTYEYRIRRSDSMENGTWKPFSVFKKVSETGYQYSLIGDFSFPGKYIVLEVRDKSRNTIESGIVINWPGQKSPGVKDTRIYYKADNRLGKDAWRHDEPLLKGYATRRNPLTGVLEELRLPHDFTYEEIIIDLSGVEMTVGYKALLERNIKGIKDTTELGFYFNSASVRINPALIAQPAQYRLIIGNTYFFRESPHDKKLLVVPFEILASSKESTKYSLREILPYAAAILGILALLFFIYYRYTKKKIASSVKDKAIIQMQLRNLRSQLNPHFLFNALTGIRNLIEKNEVKAASHYLSKFSSLTRAVLEINEDELISLEDELAIQDSYLQMEQLRFAFQYEIMVDEQISRANTEIPAMLLQPFLENAVKHGVAPLKQEGRIKVVVSREGVTMTIAISDNGKWVDGIGPVDGRTGMGIKLSRERIQLFNEIYRSETITLQLLPGVNGTIVKIQLKDWLS